MKSKLCWIPFIPLTIVAVAVKVMQNLSIVFSPDDNTASYISVCAVLLMFVINIVFVVMDKKTSPVYILSKNIPAAVFAILSAAMIASKSALEMILNLQERTFNLFTLGVTAFGILTSICMVIIAFSHLQGRNFLPRMGALFLSMPVWGGLILISEFLNNRTVSVYSVNPLTLFCYAFAMIYFFKLAMVIATVKGKNPIKSMFLYGFPLSAIGITVGVNNIFSIAIKGIDYPQNVIAFAFFALALYIVFFNIEITKKNFTNEEQLLKYDLDEFDNEENVYGQFQDNTVVTPEEQTGDYDYDYSVVTGEAENYVTAADDNYTDDYDYDYGDENDAEDLVVAPDTVEDDDVIYVEKDKADNFEEGVVVSNEEAREINAEAEVSEIDMEKIDKLIEDINS